MARSPLPASADRWAVGALGAPVPDEPEATCATCVQCAAPGMPARLARSGFHPDTKCCTFHPTLPNHLVGQLLADEDPAGAEGRRRVRTMLTTARATPLALRPPAGWSTLYAAHKADFGRAMTLRCPFYEEARGACTIWAHREAVCATYFCKHTRGARGEAFWADLRELVGAVEQALARWCLLRVGLDEGPLRSALQPAARELDDRDDEAAHRRRWGRWAGREEAFYRACADEVATLAWPDVLRIGGPAVEARVRLARASHARLLAEDVPAALRVAPFQVVELDAEVAVVVGYSALDPLRVPRVLLDALAAFDGRPTGEILGALAEEGIEMEAALATRLADFGVLAVPDDG